MFVIFILSLPFIAFSLVRTIGYKDILVSYVTAFLLLFYFFMRKNNAKIYFPREARFFFYFLVYLFISIGSRYCYGISTVKSVSQLLTVTIYFFFYILFINVFTLQDKKRAIKYVNLFILICVVFSLYSSLQAVLPTNSIVYKLFRNTNAAFIVWDPSVVIGHRLPWIGLNRVTGLAAEPGMWAAFLAVPLCLLLPRLYYKFKFRDLYSFLGILLGFLLTYGRTGFLAVFLAVIIFPCFILSGNKRKLYILFAAVIIGLCAFMTIFADISVAGGRDWSRIERANSLIVASRMFIDNPLFGVGLGGYRARAPEYRFEGQERAGGGGDYNYNLYLGLAAETGIIGLALWLLLIKSFWDKLFYQINHLKAKTEEKILYMGLGLAFLSIIFSWLNIGWINFMYIFYIFALISALSKSINEGDIVPNR